MAAPKGNKFAVGNKGGRPITKKEYEWHKEVWENDSKVRELEAKVASGTYSVRDVYLLRALKADVSILKNMADKVLATLVDHTSNGKELLPIPILGNGGLQNGEGVLSNNDNQTGQEGKDN